LHRLRARFVDLLDVLVFVGRLVDLRQEVPRGVRRRRGLRLRLQLLAISSA
jgi:hypothetical protein